MTNDDKDLIQKNSDGRFKEGRDSRSAVEMLRQGYASDTESDFALLMAEHNKKAAEFEALCQKRIEAGAASPMELLAEGFKRATEETRLRKEAKLARSAKAQAENEQLRHARLSAQPDNGLN